MKTLILTLTLLASHLFANANTDWVDAQIKAIKPPRSGVSHSAINRVKNPFIFVYKPSEGASNKSTKSGATSTESKPKVAPLRLAAIMNNSALINGTWYQVSDKVRGYNIDKIETDSVLLKSGKTKKMLFITEDNPNIKIQIK